MLKGFKVDYLEEMLNSSTKSVAREVVRTLVRPSESGVLSVLERKIDEDEDSVEETKQ